eukprot:COSAG06_NODE_1203_length_10283_cov_11.228397_6_plen_169_part_00
MSAPGRKRLGRSPSRSKGQSPTATSRENKIGDQEPPTAAHAPESTWKAWRRGAVLSGLQRERERFGGSGSTTTKVFPFILFLIYSHYSPCPFGALMGTLSLRRSITGSIGLPANKYADAQSATHWLGHGPLGGRASTSTLGQCLGGRAPLEGPCASAEATNTFSREDA